jgi:hypothetical protein
MKLFVMLRVIMVVSYYINLNYVIHSVNTLNMYLKKFLNFYYIIGYCSFEFVEKLNDFIKEKTNADPKAIVTHDLKFIITGSGKKIRIPRKFFCDQCWRKMAHIYVDYVKDHRLKKSVEENIWGNHHDLEELYLPNCKNSKRGLGEILNERREINKLSERSANPGFGAFSPRMNKLHSLRFR